MVKDSEHIGQARPNRDAIMRTNRASFGFRLVTEYTPDPMMVMACLFGIEPNVAIDVVLAILNPNAHQSITQTPLHSASG